MAFKSKVSADIGLAASPTTVTPTVGAGATATLIGLSIANKDSNGIDVSVKLVKDNGDVGFIVKDAVVLPGGALVVVGGDQKVVLEEGDSIQAYADTASAADVIVSYLE